MVASVVVAASSLVFVGGWLVARSVAAVVVVAMSVVVLLVLVLLGLAVVLMVVLRLVMVAPLVACLPSLAMGPLRPRHLHIHVASPIRVAVSLPISEQQG